MRPLLPPSLASWFTAHARALLARSGHCACVEDHARARRLARSVRGYRGRPSEALGVLPREMAAVQSTVLLPDRPCQLPVGDLGQRVSLSRSGESALGSRERAGRYAGRGWVVGWPPGREGEGGLGGGRGLEGGLDELVLGPHLDLGEGDALGDGGDGRLLLADLLAEAPYLALAALAALERIIRSDLLCNCDYEFVRN